MNRYPVKPLNLLMVGLFAAILFVPWGGNVPLFDWDEINFAESAREMLATGNFRQVQVNYTPFWEKPPLFIWLQAVSMWLWGVGEYAARFPNALVAVVSIALLYFIGNRYFKGHVGEAWVWAYLGSLFPHFYFNTGLIDPLFNLFIFTGIFQVYLATQNQFQTHYFIKAGIFTGLGILTKGPVALLVSLLVFGVYSLLKRSPLYFGWKNGFVYLFFCVLISSLWFIPEMLVNGPWFLQEFLLYQIELASQDVASHAQPFYYHAIVLLMGCFPASLFALNRMGKKNLVEKQEKDFNLFMLILFWVVLLLFSSVKTKIIHYSSLAWFPITFFAALAYDEAFRNKTTIHPVIKVLFVLISLIWAIIFFLVPLIGFSPALQTRILPLIQDTFVQANLRVEVDWKFTDLIPAIALFFGLGLGIVWVFKNRVYMGMRLLYFSIIGFIPVYALMVIPKAEKHIQGSLITFYQSLEGKACYVKPTEKSYAHYFYTRMQAPDTSDGWALFKQDYLSEKAWLDMKLNAQQRDALEEAQLNWLLYGNIDKDVYFISKIQKAAWLHEQEDLEMVHNEGGYQVFLRKTTKGENVVESPLEVTN